MQTALTLNVIASGSKGNAYILTVGKDSLLLEAGVPLKEIIKQNGYSLNGITDCLISHRHLDHSKYIKEVANSGIYVWANSDTQKTTNYAYGLINYDKPFKLTNNNFTVTAFLGTHDCEVSLFKIKHEPTGLTFAFITDTSTIPNELTAHYFFVECNYEEKVLMENSMQGDLSIGVKNSRVVQSHMSLEYLKAFKPLLSHEVKGVVILHQSKDNSSLTAYESLKTIFGNKLHMARKNKKIIL